MRTLTSIQLLYRQQLQEKTQNKLVSFARFNKICTLCVHMFNEKRSENIIWTRYRWNGCVVKWISWLGVNDCAAAWQLAPAPAAVQESQLSVKHWVLPLMVLSPSVTRQWPTCHDLSDSLSIPAWHTITHKNCSCSFVIIMTTTPCLNHQTATVTFLLQMSEDTDDNWQWVRSNPNSTGRRMVAAFVRRNQAGKRHLTTFTF